MELAADGPQDRTPISIAQRPTISLRPWLRPLRGGIRDTVDRPAKPQNQDCNRKDGVIVPEDVPGARYHHGVSSGVVLTRSRAGAKVERFCPSCEYRRGPIGRSPERYDDAPPLERCDHEVRNISNLHPAVYHPRFGELRIRCAVGQTLPIGRAS